MLMIKSNDGIYNFLEVFPLKLNFPKGFSFATLSVRHWGHVHNGHCSLGFSCQICQAPCESVESCCMILRLTLQRRTGNKQKEESTIAGDLGASLRVHPATDFTLGRSGRHKHRQENLDAGPAFSLMEKTSCGHGNASSCKVSTQP